MNIIEKLSAHQDELIAGNGASDNAIENAEIVLGVKFAPEYRQCLSAYGLFAFNGHEFTGITDNKRVNIIEVTLRQRGQNPYAPSNSYVIEEANVDGIVIWQDQKGNVLGTFPGREATHIANNLAEFLDL